MPTVPTPKGTFGDAAYAYVHAEKASSSSSGYISGPAYTLERAQPKASAAVPKASTAVPKASAVTTTHGANPATSAVAKESTESFSRALRCVCIEDETEGYIPWLAGAEPKEVVACRLECDDLDGQPTGCVATSERPSVLVDSGANEVIRPGTPGFSESGCTRTSVITANGDRIPALRPDWLLSVRRLVGAGGSFEWSSQGAVISYRSAEGQTKQICCKIINGLPFLEWEEFRPVRVALSQAYRGKPARALATKEGEGDLKASETCTMEALNDIMWAEEAYKMSTAEKEEEVKAIWSSEAQAKELLGQDALTYEAVCRLVQEAGLRGQRTKRDRLLESQEQGGRVQMWVFGMYCHGGITGLTSLTRERPFLTRLLVRLMRQELPTLSCTTVALAIDSTLKPHRDLANALNSRAGIVGISDFQGGRLWVEHADGSIKRRISADKVKVGKLVEVCQQAQTFDPRMWHGADRHQGTRATSTAYTARQLHNLDHDLIEVLGNIGFPVPSAGQPSLTKPEASSVGSSSMHQPLSPQQPTSELASPNTCISNTTSTEPQPLDDEDEMMMGFAGFIGSGLSGRCEGCGIALGEGLEVTRVPPWTAAQVEAVSLDSGFSEAARDRAKALLQRKCTQGLYERHCPDCAEAHGHKRKCRRLSPEDVGCGVLSMDLSGPHPAAFSGHRYFLVANLSMPEGDDIPFSRLLKTKTTEEVARALTSVMCQIVSLAQGAPPVFRIHSDAGKEFIGGCVSARS